MIVGIIGDRGCGKTLSMAKTVMEMLKKGRQIYTNFHLNKKHIPKKYHKQLHLIDNKFLKDYKDFKLYKCCLFIDEIYIYIDARMSGSKKNRIWSYFINQTRKRDVDLYFTTQFFRQVEIRLRMNTEFFVFPAKITKKGSTDIYIYNKIYAYKNNLKLVGVENFLGNDYFDVYDTDEIIALDEEEDKK